MDALYIRQEQEIIREYEDWKCSKERTNRKPLDLVNAPDIENWHKHACSSNGHPRFEIPCVNPECGEQALRAVTCPACGNQTERFFKLVELHSPFDAERAKAAVK